MTEDQLMRYSAVITRAQSNRRRVEALEEMRREIVCALSVKVVCCHADRTSLPIAALPQGMRGIVTSKLDTVIRSALDLLIADADEEFAAIRLPSE
jgi:hypothetical protein